MESPKRPQLFDLLPALEEFAALTIELRAPSLAELEDWEDEARERDVEGVQGVEAEKPPHWIGSAEDPRATVLGHVAWPAGEAWPWREPDAETMQAWRDTLRVRIPPEEPEARQMWEHAQPLVYAEPVRQPFVPVLQLRREDAAKLRFPDGKDLLQVLWHRFEHEVKPRVLVKWRSSEALIEGLVMPPMEEIGRVRPELAPRRQRLVAKQVWVLPDIRTTTREMMHAVVALEPELHRQSDAYRQRKRSHEQAHLGPAQAAMMQAFFSSGAIAQEHPAVIFEQAQGLMAEATRRGPVPPFDEPEPPQDYLELGLVRGIRLGVDGVCPVFLGKPLPPVGERHLLTFGSEAWDEADWVAPRNGGNIHVFVEADEETVRIHWDDWEGALPVEYLITHGWGTRFSGSGQSGGLILRPG